MANANTTLLSGQTGFKTRLTTEKIGLDSILRIFIVLCCCVVDFSINAFRVESMSMGGLLQFAFYCMALILSVSPALLTLFGDKQSESMGYMACAGTLIFSCWSIFGFTMAKADLPRVSEVQLQSIEQQAFDLDLWYEKQVKICKTRRIDQCDSAKLHDSYLSQKNALRSEAVKIQAMPAPPSQKQNTADMILMVGLSFLLQLISREFSRQLSGSWSSCRADKEEREHSLQLAQELRKMELAQAQSQVLEFQAAKKTLPRAM